jgi:hypothetical protein
MMRNFLSIVLDYKTGSSGELKTYHVYVTCYAFHPVLREIRVSFSLDLLECIFQNVTSETYSYRNHLGRCRKA